MADSLVSTRPELAGSFGMVASTHWLASQVAMFVLERGGNAADAAVAAGFTLQVVEPHLNGPAGEVPVLVAEPDGAAHVVCGQGVAPAAATPEAFADLGLTAVPGTGPLAATVPGAFGAWTLLLQRWGTWRLRDVLEPALALARDGAPVLPRVSATIGGVAALFERHWAPSAATYLDGGRAPAPWSRLRLPALAATYERVLREAEAAPGARQAGPSGREAELEAARRAWYGGFVAEAVGAFCAGEPWLDTSGTPHRGLLTAGDLAAWRPTVEAPARTTYGDVEVLKPGPWSQGPALLQQLRLLHELLPADDPLDLRDPEWAHLVVECQKLAYADREAWYGDPDAVDVPLDDLLSGAYAAQRAAEVDPRTAHADLLPGAPGGRDPRLPAGVPAGTVAGAGGGRAAAGGLALGGVGEPTVARDGATRGDTCHVDVVDADGLMISATPSGGWLQSSPVVPDLGFPLGTRAQMFWLEQGLPASLRPGVRPRTTLSPSLALRGGRPWLAFGTPGGDQQDQWSLLLLLRAVHPVRDRGLQAAIDAPMLHTEHAPSSFYPREAHPRRVVVEDRWPAAVRSELERRGHDVLVAPGWSLGRLSAVADERGPDGEGWLRGAANARGSQGYAVGR